MKERTKRAQVWKTPDSEFEDALKTSSSIKEALDKLGITDRSGNSYRVFKIRAEKLGLEDEFKAMKKRSTLATNGNLRRDPHPNSIIFNKDSCIARKVVRRRLLRDKLIPYSCALCEVQTVWNGKDLSLHLDHINGINNDHRLENLRFLCPNCHSQTPTYSGRNCRRNKS